MENNDAARSGGIIEKLNCRVTTVMKLPPKRRTHRMCACKRIISLNFKRKFLFLSIWVSGGLALHWFFRVHRAQVSFIHRKAVLWSYFLHSKHVAWLVAAKPLKSIDFHVKMCAATHTDRHTHRQHQALAHSLTHLTPTNRVENNSFYTCAIVDCEIVWRAGRLCPLCAWMRAFCDGTFSGESESGATATTNCTEAERRKTEQSKTTAATGFQLQPRCALPPPPPTLLLLLWMDSWK